MRLGQQAAQYPSVNTTAKGRVVRRVRPSSDWQRLVEQRRLEMDFSVRGLAAKGARPSAPFSHSTLFNWLHHTAGYPPTETYTTLINTRLAKAIGISPTALADAYNRSRKHFHISERGVSPAPPSVDAAVVEDALSRSRKKSWTKDDIIALVARVAAEQHETE